MNTEGPSQRNNFVSDYLPPPVPVGKNLERFSQEQLDYEWRTKWGPVTALLYLSAVGIAVSLCGLGALMLRGRP